MQQNFAEGRCLPASNQTPVSFIYSIALGFLQPFYYPYISQNNIKTVKFTKSI